MMAKAKKKSSRAKGSTSSKARARSLERKAAAEDSLETTGTGPEAPAAETSEKTQKKAEKKQARKNLSEEEREEERLRQIAEEMTADLRDVSPTPVWYKALMLGFMVIGLLWIMVFYITQQAFPVPDIGFWNIGIGIGLMMVGLVMTTRWR